MPKMSWSVATLLSFMYERPWVAPLLPCWRCSAMSNSSRSSTIDARCDERRVVDPLDEREQRVAVFW